ncbi:MAG: response regulator, partial [Gammaproteobacteria bacterium]|nr:response regulator [Gammaproteobacteria bacterium]
KMKNEFISTVSHELRTPLTAIRGALGLLTGGAVGELSEQVKSMLKIAGNNTERLLLLINDILDIQKIETSEVAFNFKSLELMPIIEQALKDNESYADLHGVKLVIAKPLRNVRAYVDKDRMMQVMANLLSNAAKFSHENDTVEISVVRHHDNTLRISVTDYGIGIPQAFQPKLFDKFTQSDSSDTRAKGGSGLGLSITKVIIEKHGGNIGFVSREGIGTTFYVELPELIDKITTDNINTSQLRTLASHPPCILIVEDDHDIAALIKRMLAEAGYNSDIAYDANQARQLLNEKPDQYKAITLDLILTDEDGISLLKSIRDEAATHDIPVVIISVKADETRHKLIGGALDVVDWLQKPIDQQRLIEVIQQISGLSRLPRVLHVEDEDDVHKVVSMMLQDYCKLTSTPTFAASKEMLEREDFDLVLLDINLPDGSGLDLIEIIEQQENPPKVVIFSAYDITQEYADKVHAVLIKSKTDNQKLAGIINAAINQACTKNK